MNAQRRRLLPLCALVMTAGCLSMPQAPAPPVGAAAAAAPTTLPQFLGLTPICKHLEVKAKCLIAMLGHSCLEPKPPLLPLSDPANLKSPIPAVAAAAKIKAAEDTAPQKIKALEYLATIGCTTCYPGKNGPLVQEAFLSGLQDCTEAVRFAAVNALLQTAGNPCTVCKQSACCGPEIMRALHDIAYKIDPASGCYVEPSARVRRVARLAMRGCGNIVPPPVVPGIPLEGPAAPAKSPAAPPPANASGTGNDSAGQKTSAVATNTESPLPPTSEVSLANGTSPMKKLRSAEGNGNPAGSEMEVVSQRDTMTLSETEDVNNLALYEQALPSIDPNVSARQRQDYYEAHPEQFSCPAEVRWERVTAAFDDYQTEELARATMEFVKQQTDGLETDPPPDVDLAHVQSRTFGWTTRTDVSSPDVAQALFSLPVGRTSTVIVDSTGCHLVRVLAQRGEQVAPLAAVREEVERRILDDRRLESKRVQHSEPPPRPKHIDDSKDTMPSSQNSEKPARTARVMPMRGMSLSRDQSLYRTDANRGTP